VTLVDALDFKQLGILGETFLPRAVAPTFGPQPRRPTR
jgi:hypothetical protein